MAGRLLRGSPYADDIMNLPVADVEGAIPYYVKTLGFTLGKREEEPISAVLSRDDVAMKIVENGGDPTQEGAFFEVDDVEVVLVNNGSTDNTQEYLDQALMSNSYPYLRVLNIPVNKGYGY